MVKFSKNFHLNFSHCLPEEQVALWLSLTSLRREEPEIDSLIIDLSNVKYETILQTLFQLNLSKAKDFFSSQPQKTIATSYCFSSVCNQMTHIGERFELENQYQHIALIWQPLMVTKNIYSISDFDSFNFLFVPDFTFNHELSFISAIFLPETNHFLSWNLSDNTVKIGCPHGVDISLPDTLFKYGGALQFEFILQAKPYKGDDITLPPYLPESLITHNSELIYLVPMGIPKLDKLHRLSSEVKSNKPCIGYHLSNWEIESEYVRKNVSNTVLSLTQNFPEFDILIRPFPGDIQRTELKKQLAPFVDHPRVKISLASSYVEDYANINILVTHRENTGHNFALGTGRPIITLLQNSKNQITQTDLGYQVNDLASLIKQLSYCIKSMENEQNRISAYANSVVFNLGHSLDYLVDNFDLIINRKSQKSWPRLALKHEDDINNNIEKSIKRCMKDRIPFIHLALAAVEKYPKIAQFNYFAAMSYSNSPEPSEHQYYYLHWYMALKYFKRAITLESKQDKSLLIKLHKWYFQFYARYLQGITAHFDETHLEIYQLINELNKEEYQKKHLHVLEKLEINLDDILVESSAFNVLKLIQAIPNNNQAIYLYGAGEVAKDVIYYLEQLTNLQIISVFDKNSNQIKSQIMGHTVHQIEKNTHYKYPIIICSLAFGSEIEAELNNLFITFPLIIKLFQ